MDQQLKENITSGATWMRCLYMVFFGVCLTVSRFVMWVVVVLQFLFALTTGSDNANLRRLGDSLSQYIFQALKFLTFNSEEKPFPFTDWPTPESNVIVGEVETAEEIAEAKVAKSEAEEQTTSESEPAAEISEPEISVGESEVEIVDDVADEAEEESGTGEKA
ncbi:MAG: DUF4389 domain-containing protein [Agarilytica sp.]